ncbi:cytochrome P450 [Mycena maculata]|uniref:Cytochrome P450 n=1 Tax=Mycena maculata TaxID=230809 RepID=A0AAD7J0S2_9AGAR|nr:cytochrome P450 [Mycena maculata]
MVQLPLLFLGATAVVTYVISKVIAKKPLSAQLPPGPKGLPLIGNVTDMPREHEWKKYAEWGRQFGDIMSVTLLNQTIVILNSARSVHAVLENHSANSSNRPSLLFACEMVGWKNALGMSQYDNRLKSMRKMVAKAIGTRSHMDVYQPGVQIETHRLLKRMLLTPENVLDHLRQTVGSIILLITYGYQVKEHDDPIIKVLFTAAHNLSDAVTPGAFLVDTLPILRYLPSWMPGGGFHKTAAKWNKTLAATVELPFNYVKDQMRAGNDIPSFTVTNLADVPPNSAEEKLVMWTSGSMYSAGADATASQHYVFFLAMTLYPDVQAKAQAELDAVVGLDRLPSFTDRPVLPYIEALFKEVLRWHQATPIGFPHRMIEDEIVDGYLVPKGAFVIPNQWQLLHDETVYKNPMEFNPDRFVGTDAERDPRDFCFGFGRRSCPGLHMGEASVWLTCAMTLAAFNIRKTKDASGKEVTPPVEFMSGTLSRPVLFPCDIKPRSAKHEALINEVDFVH